MKRSSWSDYQKEIADDKYYYVRSCIRQNFFPGSEKAFLNMLQKDLGRDVFDDPLHTSCTGIGYHSDIVPLDTIMTVVARQFALMTDAGYENFISSCITSFGIYTEILATWEEFPEKEEQTREYLYKATGREFRKPKSLAHTSDIVFHLREEIARKAKYRLVNAATGEPLRVVEHIGCHYAKIFPKAGIGGSEFPYVLAGMIDAWAASASIIPSGAIAAVSDSATTWCRPTGAIRWPIRTRNSRAWLPTSPISSWPTVRDAPCSSTNGNIRSPRWRASPTVRTDEVFRY